MNQTGLGLKQLVLIVGVIMSLIGIIINNWRLATAGNTVAVIGLVLT